MASIKEELRALSYREATPDDMGEFFAQIKHEANARGAAILIATNVEIALTHAIFRLLEWDDKSRGGLSSAEGPVGTFAQKIHLGRGLRIYGQETFDNLDWVRRIRNTFAHSHSPITFDTTEIKKAIDQLKMQKPLSPVAVPADGSEPKAPSTSREQFERCCEMLVHNLFIYSITAFYEKRGPLDTIEPTSIHRVFYWRKAMP